MHEASPGGSCAKHLCQADSIDLICAAMITSATGYMREKYGKTGLDALKKATGTYGRFADAAKYIDPRKE